jgi:hypothetical protein
MGRDFKKSRPKQGHRKTGNVQLTPSKFQTEQQNVIDTKSLILCGAVADLLHWQTEKLPRLAAGQVTTDARRHAYDRIRWAEVGQVECRAAAWLGRAMTPADRVAVSRAYEALERDGLVVRLSAARSGSKRRTVALRVLEAGEARGRELLAIAVDSTPIEAVPVVTPAPTHETAPRECYTAPRHHVPDPAAVAEAQAWIRRTANIDLATYQGDKPNLPLPAVAVVAPATSDPTPTEAPATLAAQVEDAAHLAA